MRPAASTGFGTHTWPASTSGETADARAYLPPSGDTGISAGTRPRRLSSTAGPFAVSSTRTADVSGKRWLISAMAWQVSVKAACALYRSTT